MTVLLVCSLVGALLASVRGATILRRPHARTELRPYPFVPLELLRRDEQRAAR